MTLSSSEVCPCGSQRLYIECCGPFHLGHAQAPTAEALMRSRYTAFVKRLQPYLQQTAAQAIRAQFLNPPDPIEWVGLKILSTENGGLLDQSGTVEFAAFLKDRGRLDVLHERSTFHREDGRWVYAAGELAPSGSPNPLSLLGRNDPCPCGSGRKFKKCCGA